MREYRRLEEYVYDIIVIGGGMGGICAAIAAARLGCKVALVHDRPVLGGATSTEVRVNIGGADHPRMVRSARETGIIEELRIEDRYRNYAKISNSFINSTWDMVLWEYVTREPNLTLFLNTSARHAIMAGREKKIIKAVESVQLGTEKIFHLFADFFIDASGDGAIAYDAGAEFRIGRESRLEFNESIAPEKADDHVIGGAALLFKVADVGHPVCFVRPSWAYEFPTDKELPFRNHSNWQHAGFWWMMYGGTLNTVFDYEKIRDELYKILYGVWNHVKNHGEHGADNYALEWVGAVPGKLESRRFMGDYILTQNDLFSMSLFPDRVSYGGAAIDLHPPEGVFSPEPPTNEHETLLPGLYSIPFRCLYSKNVDNLMMAGRIISATHIAHGSSRFIATGAVNGQAAGTASYLCKKYGVTPRELLQKHIHELQQLLLKNDCYIIGIRNEDSDDIARTASVTVSSSAKLETTDSQGAHALECVELGWHGMKRTVSGRAQLFPVSESFIESISLLLKSTKRTEVQLGLCKAESLYDFSAEVDLATSKAVVQGEQPTWITFDLNQKISPGLYWIHLYPNPEVSWCFTTGDFPGLQAAYFGAPVEAYFEDFTPYTVPKKLPPLEDKWRLEEDVSYCFKIASWPYGGHNTVNGFSRPDQGPNIWISDPNQPLPQYLELDFGEKKSINTVYLTFDTNLDLWINELVGPVPECVKDYTLSYWNSQSWVEIFTEKGNHQRHRIHHFKSVTTNRLRLTVLATNGANTARVYEIRVYSE